MNLKVNVNLYEKSEWNSNQNNIKSKLVDTAERLELLYNHSKLEWKILKQKTMWRFMLLLYCNMWHQSYCQLTKLRIILAITCLFPTIMWHMTSSWVFRNFLITPTFTTNISRKFEVHDGYTHIWTILRGG